MSLRIIQPGMYSSMQDLGRSGYRAIGVPESGAMDTQSAQIANILVGNRASDTVIEFTHHGAALIAESPMIVAHCGGGASLWINDYPAVSGRGYLVKQSTLLQLKSNPSGYRSYLAVSGGFEASLDLGSSSTYTPAAMGGLNGRILKTGDQLRIRDQDVFQRVSQYFYPSGNNNDVKATSWGYYGRHYQNAASAIRIIKGPEWDCFTNNAIETFLNSSFRITTQSNRMGFRLQGKSLITEPLPELISTNVTMGTIQVTHEGDLIMLMADAQTTGGYPRIAQIASTDLSACAQLKPDEEIRFTLISAEEAEDLYLKKERDMFLLSEYIQMKYR
ncbi:biotin-dependent carboxyltransferase family protein [Pollutibacter soli]|uniref:5-oxoprolinase subunit C family protein n=1 Tax=Pollutibacter soli TaxID=3034157 RepID=UPI003013CCA7